MIAATLFAMAASAVLGYATVALNGNELGLIGSIIGGVCTIIAAMMTISAASRRQRREFRYQRKGSGMTGFLLGLLLISIAAIVYFASRPNPGARASDASVPATPPTASPTVEPTTLPAVVATTSTGRPPITLAEASGFVSSYLETGNNEATVDQAWAMFTDAHAALLSESAGGIEEFHVFWKSVITVTTGTSWLTGESTDSQAVVHMPLTYQWSGTHACFSGYEVFTVVRINGVLKIADDDTTHTGPC